MNKEQKDVRINPMENAFNTVISGNQLGRVNFGKPRTVQDMEQNKYIEGYFRDSERHEVEARLVVVGPGRFELIANRGNPSALIEMQNELAALGVDVIEVRDNPATSLERSEKNE